MADDDVYYSDDELRSVFATRPLGGLHVNEIVLLLRHWQWANLQRHRAMSLFAESEPPDADGAWLASEWFLAHALWNSLLWVVIEGFNDRGVVLGGRMGEDVAALSPTLRGFRNATFHVSRRQEFDPRLTRFMRDPLTVPRVSRVSEGIGGLFWHEQQEWKREGRIPDDDAGEE